MRTRLEVPIDTIRLADGVTLSDRWFALRWLDDDTLAIGEPAYHQVNWSYLIRDGDQALLFDTGSGRRDISGLVARHVGAVRALPSHMHFDHLGNITRFDTVLVADLPMLRACVADGVLTPDDELFLGHYEDLSPPSFPVAGWVAPGSTVEVGTRRLEIVHTPGHSPDSISLSETARNRFYAADFLYPGDLYAQTPGASLPDYLATAERLLDELPQDVEFVCAHGGPGADGSHDCPRLGRDDLAATRDALVALRRDRPRGEGAARVNDRLRLRYGEAAFAGW